MNAMEWSPQGKPWLSRINLSTTLQRRPPDRRTDRVDMAEFTCKNCSVRYTKATNIDGACPQSTQKQGRHAAASLEEAYDASLVASLAADHLVRDAEQARLEAERVARQLHIASLPFEERPAGKCQNCNKRLNNKQLAEDICMQHICTGPKHEKDFGRHDWHCANCLAPVRTEMTTGAMSQPTGCTPRGLHQV